MPPPSSISFTALTLVPGLPPTATQADAFATAVMVLGAEEGLAFAEQWKLAAMTLTRNADGSFTEARNALYPEPLEPALHPTLDSNRDSARDSREANRP